MGHALLAVLGLALVFSTTGALAESQKRALLQDGTSFIAPAPAPQNGSLSEEEVAAAATAAAIAAITDSPTPALPVAPLVPSPAPSAFEDDVNPPEEAATPAPTPENTPPPPPSSSSSASAAALASAQGSGSPIPAPEELPPDIAPTPPAPIPSPAASPEETPVPVPAIIIPVISSPSPAPTTPGVAANASADANASASAGTTPGEIIAPAPGIVVSNASAAGNANAAGTSGAVANASATALAIAIARDGAPGTPGAAGAPGQIIYIAGPPGPPGLNGNATATATATATAIVSGTTTVNGQKTAGVGVGGLPVSSDASGSAAIIPLQTPVASPPPPPPSPPSIVPSPPPPPPPQCLVEPQCRLYVEDMQCCQTEGLLTDKTTAFLHILCSHPVAIPQGCLTIVGPSNVTEYPVFNGNGPSYNYRSIVNWQTDLPNGSPYSGPISLDLESARTEDATCALNLATPCTFNDTLYTAVAEVKDLNFTTLPPTTFFEDYVGCPANNLGALDSWAWTDPTPGSSMCMEQETSFLPPTFFQGGWIFYNGGFQIPCNATATSQAYETLLTGCPANDPVAAAAAAAVAASAAGSGRRLF